MSSDGYKRNQELYQAAMAALKEERAKMESDDIAENERADKCGEATLVLFVLALLVALVVLGSRKKA